MLFYAVIYVWEFDLSFRELLPTHKAFHCAEPQWIESEKSAVWIFLNNADNS